MRKASRKGFVRGRFLCGSFVADVKLLFFRFGHGETITVEAERCCCAQETQSLLAEQLPTASQEGQNSQRISRKVYGRCAEASRKGGPVFAGKCPRSTGSSMGPKPTQDTAKHYFLSHFPSLLNMTFLLHQYSQKQVSKTCAAEGLWKQTMKHMRRGSSRKGPLGLLARGQDAEGSAEA